MNRRWQLWVVMIAGAMLYLLPSTWQGWNWSPAQNRKFSVSSPMASGALAQPEMREEFLDPAFTVPSAHVSSICELPGGRLAAAWYAGTREGAQDVAVRFAIRSPGEAGTWSASRPIVTRETSMRDTFRYVKKVGNPLIFSGEKGELYLLYVSIALGGWSGSSLNITKSLDDGATWSTAQAFGLSPFFNVSTLVKNGPTPLRGGGWVVPIYHELIGKFPELLWLEEAGDGFKAAKTRVAGGRHAFQPALAALDPQTALMFCRAVGTLRKTYLSRTEDAGVNWSAPAPIEPPNSDAGLDVIRLADGRLLLAFNDTPKLRENLTLAVSQDAGRNWRRAAVVEREPGAEFSYPFLLQTADGQVHLTYTWKRRGIKHVTFNLAWLDAQLSKEAR